LTVDAPQGVLNNDSDPDGTPLSAQNASDPPQGSVQLNADGSFTYTPDLGAVGDDSFTYEASDGTLTSTGTVTITITP
jgi:VCBS repeat-containing protein